MRKYLSYFILLFIIELLCLTQQSSKAFWQSRDSNYNQSIAAGGTVAPDQIMSDSALTRSGPAATTFTMTGQINITAGLTNPAVVVGIVQCNGASNITGVTATYDGASMFQVGSASQLTITGLWFGLRNPTSGAGKILTINWTNAAQIKVMGVSFSGVAGSDVAAFKNFTSASNTAPITVNVTSAIGHKTVAAMGSLANFTSVNNTQVALDNACSTWAVAGNYASGAGLVAMTGSPGSAVTSLAVGMDVSP